MAVQNVSPEPPQVVRAAAEIGIPGIDIFDGYVRADPETQLVGQMGVSQYDLMRREDATVASALGALALPIRRANYEWRTEGDPAIMEFVESCFDDMDGSFDDLISEVCTMFAFGWSYFVWQLKKRSGPKPFGKGGSKYDDGRLGFNKISMRTQSSLRRWQVDEVGNIHGMWQLTNNMNAEVFLPISQSLLFRTSKEGNNPEGFSLLRPCWRAWRYKREIERIEAIGLQRALMGTPVVKLEPGASNIATAGWSSDEGRARTMIADLHGNRTFGLIEDSFLSFRFETPKMQGITGDSSAVLKRKDEDLARALLAMFIMLGSQEQGSWALSRELADIFFLSVEGYLGVILDVINEKAVPVLMKWNGITNTRDYPYLHATVNRRIDLETVCQVVNDLTNSGVLTPDAETEVYIRKLIGLPEGDPEARVRPVEPVEVANEPIEEQSFAYGDQREQRYRNLERRYRQMLDNSILAWSRKAVENLQSIPEPQVSASTVLLVWSQTVDEMEEVKEVGWEYLPRGVELGYRSGALPKSARAKIEEEIGSNDGYINNRLKPLTVRRMDAETAALIVTLLLAGQYDELEEVIGGLVSVIRRHAAMYAGQLWHAIMVGAAEWAMDNSVGPVRWKTDALARHCSECPIYAAEYESMEHLLSATGGTLPGMGTECNGGCRCHLEHLAESGWTWL